jgi:hypothetical protein
MINTINQRTAMKKLTFLLLTGLVILVSGNNASAQDTGEKDFRFTVKTNPLSVLGGPLYAAWIVPLTNEYKVYFEAQTMQKQSIQIGLGYLGTSPVIQTLINMADAETDTTVTSGGFHGQIWYKFFLTGDDAPAGFYLGPHFSYAWAKMKNNYDDSQYVTASKMNIHCVFGYQVITKGGFALDIYTGLGVKNKAYETPGGEMEEWLDDLNLTNKFTVSVPLGFTFGYAF